MIHYCKTLYSYRMTSPSTSTTRAHHDTVYWCNFNLAQRKGLRFYQTRAHAIALSDDNVVCMKTGEEFYCRIYKSPRLPRVTHVPNSQHVQKDVLVSESRKSDDRENEVHQHRETCGSDYCVDFRIPGIPHSAVEQVATNRTGNMLLKDFEKSEEVNHFSQESKDLITEKGNNEIFEFYETSSTKKQCPDCALHWEFGNVYCTCGKCMQPTAMNRQYNKDRYDSLSSPGYVIKKNQSRGPRHGQPMRQIMYHKARDMLRKAKLPKKGSCETILERWHTDAVCQNSLSDEG